MKFAKPTCWSCSSAWPCHSPATINFCNMQPTSKWIHWCPCMSLPAVRATRAPELPVGALPWAGQGRAPVTPIQLRGQEGITGNEAGPSLCSQHCSGQTKPSLILQRILPLLERFQGVQSYWWFSAPITTNSTHFRQTNLFTLFLKITKNRGVAPFSPSSLIKQCLIENTIYLRRISSPKFSRRTEFLPHFKGSKLSRRKYHITFEISFIIPEHIFSHKPLKVAQLWFSESKISSIR